MGPRLFSFPTRRTRLELRGREQVASSAQIVAAYFSMYREETLI
jgi:hypothetical protein